MFATHSLLPYKLQSQNLRILEYVRVSFHANYSDQPNILTLVRTWSFVCWVTGKIEVVYIRQYDIFKSVNSKKLSEVFRTDIKSPIHINVCDVT